MHKRYAILEEGVVVNVVLWDGEKPLEGYVLHPCGDDVGVGHIIQIDGTFINPDAPEPDAPTTWQSVVNWFKGE